MQANSNEFEEELRVSDFSDDELKIDDIKISIKLEQSINKKHISALNNNHLECEEQGSFKIKLIPILPSEELQHLQLRKKDLQKDIQFFK